MTTLGLAAALATLAALTLVQALGATGRPVGRVLWGGRHRVLPPRLRLASVAAIALYAGFAVLLLARAGHPSGAGSTPVAIAVWVLFGYLVIGTLGNAVSPSRAERAVMTPTCALLAVATLLVALA